MLPKFLTIRIFALEYIRQRLNFDYIHFSSKKQKVTFKLKKEVGPFIVNTRATFQVAEKLLQEMGFQQGEVWTYDPHLIITNKRTKMGTIPYGHHSKPQLEPLENQDSWEDVQRILQIQIQDSVHPSHSLVIETPQQHEKINKRTYSKYSPIVSELEEGKSNKKKKIEEQPEVKSQTTQSVSESSTNNVAVTIEFLPTTNIQILGTQARKEVMEEDQSEYKNIFSQFKSIKENNLKSSRTLILKFVARDHLKLD
jgi:hypothetical protein